jgi:hypothetical protein
LPAIQQVIRPQAGFHGLGLGLTQPSGHYRSTEMTLKEIRRALEHALLEEGEMHRELYEYELEEHVDYWSASMRRDRD